MINYEDKKRIIILSVIIIAVICLVGFFQFFNRNESVDTKIEMGKVMDSSKSAEMHHTMDMTEEGTMTNMQKNKKIKMSVKFNTDELVLTNNETIDWQECQLELNATIVKRGYMFSQNGFPTGEAVHIPLTKFIRESMPFDPSHAKAQNLMVMCSSKDGMSGWNYFTNK